MRTEYYPCAIPTKDAQPESIPEGTPDKPKVRHIIQSNWPVPFKSVQVMRVNERLRNGPD